MIASDIFHLTKSKVLFVAINFTSIYFRKAIVVVRKLNILLKLALLFMHRVPFVDIMLSSKQDIKRPIDELENLVGNLDIEHIIKVEICLCIWQGDQLEENTIGIKNGCKWLLDIIVKGYAILNSKLKNQNAQSKRNIEIQSVLLDSSSRLSIHSIVFKLIKELVLKWEDAEGKSRPFI